MGALIQVRSHWPSKAIGSDQVTEFGKTNNGREERVGLRHQGASLSAAWQPLTLVAEKVG